MSVSAFNVDDAALAVSIITDTAIADLPFVNRQQSDADFARVSTEARSLVTNVMRLHGLTQLGNPMDGDEDGAKKIIDATNNFQADPAGYTEAIFGPEAEPATAIIASEPEPNVAPTAIPMAPAITPPQAFTQIPIASGVETEVAKIRFIPRPAQTLFSGISASYNNEMIPTAQWDTPKPVIEEPDPDFIFNGYAVTVMALALEEQKNVLATGDPGCGKTEFFKQFGARVGLPVHKIPMDGSLSRSEIIGSFQQISTPTGSATPFVLGKIPRLIQSPGIIILDEIDQADPDIMYMLHSVLEGGGLNIQENGDVFIPRHPNCYIVGTANTKGRGSDNGLTHTPFEMSEATRDRFPYWLNFTFLPADKEVTVLQQKTGLSPKIGKKLVEVANMIRNAYTNGTMSQTCSLRQMLDAAPLAMRFASRGDEIGLAIGMEGVMVGRANTEDAAAIREFIKSTSDIDLNVLEF